MNEYFSNIQEDQNLHVCLPYCNMYKGA